MYRYSSLSIFGTQSIISVYAQMRRVPDCIAVGCGLVALLFVAFVLQSDWHEAATARLNLVRLAEQDVQQATTSINPGDSASETPPPAALTQAFETSLIVQDPRFAYVFYATSDEYACSVLVNIYRLRHILRTAYTTIHVLISPTVSPTFVAALEKADALVHIETPPVVSPDSASYYDGCMLKLLALKLHRLTPGLERVLVLDADQLVMQNLDHLFSGLPRVDLAAPRAYWLAKDFLASTFMMIELSDRLWATVRDALESSGSDKYDMDLVNDLLGESELPSSGYATLTQFDRRPSHDAIGRICYAE